MNNIYLIGFAGVGKSTLGEKLATELGMNFLDTDVLIEERMGKTIPEIFEEHGEGYFRKKEHQMLQHLLDINICDCIISTGGGMPIHNNNLQLMKDSGVVIWLERDLEHIYNGLRNNPRKGVRFSSRDEFDDLYAARLEYYAQAGHHLNIEEQPINQIKDQVLSWVS